VEHDAAIYFRDQFRDARARALHDAEAYQEVLFSIERFGSALTGTVGALGSYSEKVIAKAKDSPLAEDIPLTHRDWHVPFPALYEVVKDARNDALHQGASARHLTAHATQLVIALEDALNENATNVGDYMVRDPLCASPWQPISLIRQQMLANNFTYLPIWDERGAEPRWRLVSDHAVAKYLRSAPSKNGKDGRKERLAKTVKGALSSGESTLTSGRLTLTDTRYCASDTIIEEVLEVLDGPPVLIVDRYNDERLVGILTPFDLL
jgi:CBS domain-containing protein